MDDAHPAPTAPAADAPGPIRLRPHAAGDIGWLIGRHGALYAAEYQWNLQFEALVAQIAGQFLQRFDASREACWIAERIGASAEGVPQRLGSVVLAQARDETTGAAVPGVAQLRLLLVEPAARGEGLGARLVGACEAFARQAGYQRIRLWTQHNLSAARHIYQRAGYRLTDSAPHHSFGHDLVGEMWEKPLD
jgi:GNAT superfamily N-acetyltransferase